MTTAAELDGLMVQLEVERRRVRERNLVIKDLCSKVDERSRLISWLEERVRTLEAENTELRVQVESAITDRKEHSAGLEAQLEDARRELAAQRRSFESALLQQSGEAVGHNVKGAESPDTHSPAVHTYRSLRSHTFSAMGQSGLRAPAGEGGLITWQRGSGGGVSHGTLSERGHIDHGKYHTHSNSSVRVSSAVEGMTTRDASMAECGSDTPSRNDANAVAIQRLVSTYRISSPHRRSEMSEDRALGRTVDDGIKPRRSSAPPFLPMHNGISPRRELRDGVDGCLPTPDGQPLATNWSFVQRGSYHHHSPPRRPYNPSFSQASLDNMTPAGAEGDFTDAARDLHCRRFELFFMERYHFEMFREGHYRKLIIDEAWSSWVDLVRVWCNDVLVPQAVAVQTARYHLELVNCKDTIEALTTEIDELQSQQVRWAAEADAERERLVGEMNAQTLMAEERLAAQRRALDNIADADRQHLQLLISDLESTIDGQQKQIAALHDGLADSHATGEQMRAAGVEMGCKVEELQTAYDTLAERYALSLQSIEDQEKQLGGVGSAINKLTGLNALLTVDRNEVSRRTEIHNEAWLGLMGLIANHTSIIAQFREKTWANTVELSRAREAERAHHTSVTDELLLLRKSDQNVITSLSSRVAEMRITEVTQEEQLLRWQIISEEKLCMLRMAIGSSGDDGTHTTLVGIHRAIGSEDALSSVGRLIADLEDVVRVQDELRRQEQNRTIDGVANASDFPLLVAAIEAAPNRTV